MQRMRAWGYDYLKLDFLYGGALPGKRAQTRQPTNSEATSQPSEVDAGGSVSARAGCIAARHG